MQHIWARLIGPEPLKFRLFKAITEWITRRGSPNNPPDQITEQELIGEQQSSWISRTVPILHNLSVEFGRKIMYQSPLCRASEDKT